MLCERAQFALPTELKITEYQMAYHDGKPITNAADLDALPTGSKVTFSPEDIGKPVAHALEKQSNNQYVLIGADKLPIEPARQRVWNRYEVTYLLGSGQVLYLIPDGTNLPQQYPSY